MSETNSIWMDYKVQLDLPKLNKSLHTETIVVGAGITGLMTAYLLAKAGRKVIVLDKNSIGGGETSFTTAFIIQALDTDLQQLAEIFGKEDAKRIWQAAQSSIDLIERVIVDEQIECEFKRLTANIFIDSTDGVEFLQDEVKLANELGFDLEFHPESLTINSTAYVSIPNQAKFHPLKFLEGLAAAVIKHGGEIFVETTVTDSCCEQPVKVTANGFELTADYVIFATHQPINNAPEVVMRLRPMQTYVIAGVISKGTIPEGLYWDTAEPYHYLRIDSGETQDRFLFGGLDHETGKSNEGQGQGLGQDRFQQLEGKLQGLLTPNFQLQVSHHWSGQVIESLDGAPFIGSIFGKKHHLIATGFGGDGMTLGTLSAMINSDIVLGKENQYLTLFDYIRFNSPLKLIRRGIEFMSHFIGERINAAPKQDAHQLATDAGVIIREGGKQIAVYKDELGNLHKYSAVCTHLGCIVQWNNEAKTWDCPCHGSRFDKHGVVMAGPAAENLEKIS